MTFKTLMRIRSVITSNLLEVDGDIEDIKNEIDNIEDKSESGEYDFKIKRLRELAKKQFELKMCLEEIEATEMK